MATSPTEGVAAFRGRVWLLRDRKTTFSAATWQEETAALYLARVPFSTQPQPLLELQPSGASLLIVRVHNAVGNEAPSEGGKLRLALEVRTMEDVRKAQVYHTAAPSRPLELFLDSAADRDRLIVAIHAPSPSATAASLPVAPVVTESSKKLLDDAFAALERAQQERDAGRIASALDGFRHAERGFRAAERLLPDERSRQLLQQRREDLQRTIASLASSPAPAKPAEKPQQVAPTPRSDIPTPPPPPPQTGMDILARLEELRQFAATQPPPQESTPASEANAPSNDLTRRLAALRGPSSSTSSSSSTGTSGAAALDLAARLRRLRAGGDAEDPGAVELDEVATRAEQDVRSLGSVGRLVAQAQDEVALGMVDDLDEASSISSDSIDSSSSSDSDGSASNASRKARRRE